MSSTVIPSLLLYEPDLATQVYEEYNTQTITYNNSTIYDGTQLEMCERAAAAARGTAALCAVCRSARPLGALHECTRLYRLLLEAGHATFSEISDRQICWECRARLRNISRFQKLVVESYTVLQAMATKGIPEKELRLKNLQSRANLNKSKTVSHEYVPTTNESICTKTVNYELLVNTNKYGVAIVEQVKQEPPNEHDDSNHLDDGNLVVAEPLCMNPSSDKPEESKPSNESEGPKRKCKNVLSGSKNIKKTSRRKTSSLKIVKSQTKDNITLDLEVTDNELIYNSVPKTIFRRSTKSCGYAFRPIDEDKFSILHLNDDEMMQSRVEDAVNEKYWKQPYKCELCIKGFKQEKQLTRHQKLKHDTTTPGHSCDVCAARFPSARLVRAHRRHHAVRYECRACGARERHMRDMLRHYAQRHGAEVYTCALCGLALRSAGAYRYHREGHKERAECDYCGRTFQSRAGLFSHIVIHMNLPRVPCPLCHKSVRNKYALSKHMLSHAARPADSRHYCRQCEIYFTSKYSYRHHLKTSSKHVKPEDLRFVCAACDKRFYTEKRMKEHFNSVHLKQTEHQCTICMKSFCNRNTLRIHVQGVHERLRAPRDKICDHCGKAFYCAGSLRVHVRTHTGERPYSCDICAAAFTQSSSLRTHRARVHPDSH